MVRRVLGLTGLGIVAVVLLWAAPAEARITRGSCQGTATITDDGGARYRISASDTGRVTLPPEGAAAYSGTEGRGRHGGKVAYSGKVTVEGPPGLSYSRDWSGESEKSKSSGVETYDFEMPADLLGGVKATVKGVHRHGPVDCAAVVDIKIEGSVVNPGSIAAAVLTVGAGAGLLLAARGAR